MTNMYFQLCSFFYMLMILIIFISKKRINNGETKIFSVLSLINIFGIVLDIVIVYLSYIVPGHSCLYFLNKIYLMYIIFWTSVFSLYITYITIDKKYKKIYTTLTLLFPTIISVVIIFLPLYLFNENNVMYTYGPSVTLTYLSEVVLGVVITVISLLKPKRLITKKYSPLVALVLLTIFGLVVRLIDPGILLTTSIMTFINILMYHTIENPDMMIIEELNVAKDQAEKANNAKTDFLSNMSHEIRTPLNAIVGFSEILKSKSLSDDEKEDVDNIIVASENLLEIVNGILDISKIEANKLEIINSEYEFKQIYRELISLTKTRIGTKKIDFRFNIDENIPDVLYGDKLRIKQIILNLLTNSVKYTKEGIIEFNVNSVKKDGVCRLIISVTDSGTGIKKENIEKLFTKFERFEHKNSTIEGTGLGLAITKKLVELMNGKIVVQSEYGSGSKFTIAIDQKIVDNPTIELYKEEVIEEIDCSGKKIVIVDDNSINLKVASKFLSKYNLSIETLDSGFDLLEKIIDGEKYDLILLDDMMPNLSGKETLKELKTISDFNIPTIVLTANAISGMKEEYLSSGFDDYLAKPINKAELNRIIKKYLVK